MTFILHAGDCNGLVSDEDHLIYKWDRDDCLILFSVCRKGDAASCHFSSDKKGLRKVKDAIEAFSAFLFFEFKWCKMIIAQITIPSVCRIVEKLNFEYLGTCKGCEIYIRGEHG